MDSLPLIGHQGKQTVERVAAIFTTKKKRSKSMEK
jgi:hypothetical protein